MYVSWGGYDRLETILNVLPTNTKPIALHGKETIINNIILNDNSLEGMLWNKVYKRELIGNLQIPNFKVCEDSYFSLNLIKNAPKDIVAYYINIPFYHYRNNSQSIIHRLEPKNYNDAVFSYKKILADFNDYLSPQAKESLLKGLLNWQYKTSVSYFIENNKENFKKYKREFKETYHIIKKRNLKLKIKKYILKFPILIKLLYKK